MQKSLGQRIEQGLERSGREYEMPLAVLSSFIAGNFLTLLKWWLENKRTYSPEQMDEMFRRLTLHGIESQLEN
jgi:hypothetical protein